MIAPLLKNEINELAPLQPHDWSDIRNVFLEHIDYHYFKAFTYKHNGSIIGVGQYIQLKKTIWLGNIIIHPDFRSLGIGTQLTVYLVEESRRHDPDSIFLLSTPLGKPLYEKLAFEHIGHYYFYKHPPYPKDIYPYTENVNAKLYENKNLRKATTADHDHIFELDFRAMGEDRSEVLKHFLSSAIVFERDKFLGFYLPDLGDGLIISDEYAAGAELFSYRWFHGAKYSVLPEDQVLLQLNLNGRGFKMYRTAYLMKIGQNKTWDPSMIYSRLSGHLG